MPPFKLLSLPFRSALTAPARRSTLTALLAGLTLGALASAPAALASHSEAVYFEGSTDLLSPVTRPHAIAQLQALGVKALRVELSWYDVAPGQKSATKPNFEATNPAGYSWGEYDALIDEAQALGWKVLLTVTSPVPRWATSNKAGAVRHEPRHPRLRTVHDRRRPPLRLERALFDLERAQPPRVPAPAVHLPGTARPRRASIAACTRLATRACRPPGSRIRRY